MKSFQYLRPERLSEAISILERMGSGARPLLGGTDLIVRLQKGQADLDAVVDLKRVRDIDATIGLEGGKINVGARVVLSDLVRDVRIREHLPALVEAASIIGSIQIRNRATLVGNICNASPAADTVPPLMAYSASVQVAKAAGSREVSLEKFSLGPGKTACGPTELVVAVQIPIPRQPFGCAFGRLTRRRGVDLAIINMACAIGADGITTFAFGAAAPTVIIARDETGELARLDLPEPRRDELLLSLIDRTSPISDVRSGGEYRRAMLLTIGRRVLCQAQRRRQAWAG